MGRPKRERRVLSAEEQAQVQRLKGMHAELVENVTTGYYGRHKLRDEFEYEEILSVATEGLHEAIEDYVEHQMLPAKQEKSYQALSIEFSPEQERRYLAKSVRNKIIDHIRRERSVRRAKERLEPSLEEMREKGKEVAGEFTFPVDEIGEYESLPDALKAFAKTLPLLERTVLVEIMRDAEAGYQRTASELADCCKITVRHLRRAQLSLITRLCKWNIERQERAA